jgi:hypothetical protein
MFSTPRKIGSYHYLGWERKWIPSSGTITDKNSDAEVSTVVQCPRSVFVVIMRFSVAFFSMKSKILVYPCNEGNQKIPL